MYFRSFHGTYTLLGIVLPQYGIKESQPVARLVLGRKTEKRDNYIIIPLETEALYRYKRTHIHSEITKAFLLCVLKAEKIISNKCVGLNY